MEIKRSQHGVIELTDAELEAIYGGQDDSSDVSSSDPMKMMGRIPPTPCRIPKTPGRIPKTPGRIPKTPCRI
jgi:hypothetical protein